MESSSQTSEDKKELKTRTARNSIHFEFYFAGGGEVPDMLKGLYTDEFAIEMAKKDYFEKRDPTPEPFVRKASGKPVKVK